MSEDLKVINIAHSIPYMVLNSVLKTDFVCFVFPYSESIRFNGRSKQNSIIKL